MYLIALIRHLEAMNSEALVSFGFGSPHSYRGYYDQVAFEPEDSARIGDMLRFARSALGATFTGYKGGDFTIDEYTPTHIASYGVSGDFAISEALVRYWEKEAANA